MPKKKRRGKLTRVRIESPAVFAGQYNPMDSLKEINKLLREIASEVAYDVEQTTPLFNKSLLSGMGNAVKHSVLDADYSSADKLIKKLSKVLKKKAKLYAIEVAVNDAYQNLNRGELLGAQATKQKTVKQWITQFDSKVRSWHARVNYQERELNQRFTVPIPKGGVDYLKAPKIPPISVENFINCRCSVQYAIIKS